MVKKRTSQIDPSRSFSPPSPLGASPAQLSFTHLLLVVPSPPPVAIAPATLLQPSSPSPAASFDVHSISHSAASLQSRVALRRHVALKQSFSSSFPGPQAINLWPPHFLHDHTFFKLSILSVIFFFFFNCPPPAYFLIIHLTTLHGCCPTYCWLLSGQSRAMCPGFWQW